MDETANHKLPLIRASQAQKHVTHNEALLTLDAALQLSVASRSLSNPAGGRRRLPLPGRSRRTRRLVGTGRTDRRPARRGLALP